MSGYIVLLIVLTCIGGYAYGGFRYAVDTAAAQTERDIAERTYKPTLADVELLRRWNLELAWFTALIWPLALLARRLNRAALGSMPRTTLEREAELDAREGRIQQLERELGMRTDGHAS